MVAVLGAAGEQHLPPGQPPVVGGDMLRDGRQIKPFDVFMVFVWWCEAAAVSPGVSDTVIMVERIA